MSSLDYLDLCRLCLVKDRANVPIFEGEGDVRQIFFKIAACLPVKVVKEDNLPKKICDDCVYKVEQFYQFWNTTANVEKQLLQWLGDVGMEEKQGYVSGILNPDQSVEGRLNANVIQQTDEHQNNMGMNMMDTMNLDMPMMMQTEQSQMTTMNSNDTNVQTIQAVPGTSVRPPQQERRKDDEDESSEDEDNSDDECDADEGLSVKEETEETANRTIEPTFVNVSLPCDEAGPSGLQQQKINEMSDMVMTQSTDGDPKSGEGETFGGLSGMLRQILSPSPESGDGSYAGCCNMIQPSIFTNYPMLSSSIQHVLPTSSPYHHTSHSTSLISLEQAGSPLDHLQIHVESHQCPNCGLDFRSVPKLNYHIRMCHQININDNRRRLDGNEIVQNQNLKYSCTMCGRMFQTLSHLRMHEVSHTPQQQIQQIQPIQHVQQNVQTISNETNDQTFGCDRCQASFRYRTLLERHKKMHMVGQDKPYVCPRCPMRFETRTLYNHHAKTHKPVVNNPPIITQNVVNQSGNLNHLNLVNSASQAIDKTLESPNSYSCDSCSKQFLTIESLTSHKAVHRSRPLVCDVCGKGFTHRKYYVVHQRIHTGERPYLCAMCGKSFTQASTLTVHRRYHTGERPYTCTLCGKGFVTRTIMLNHMKKH